MSEGDHLPGKSEEELAVESFVDSIMEIHPNLDREQFHNAISERVQEFVSEEEGDEDDDDGEQEGS